MPAVQPATCDRMMQAAVAFVIGFGLTFPRCKLFEH